MPVRRRPSLPYIRKASSRSPTVLEGEGVEEEGEVEEAAEVEEERVGDRHR